MEAEKSNYTRSRDAVIAIAHWIFDPKMFDSKSKIFSPDDRMQKINELFRNIDAYVLEVGGQSIIKGNLVDE
jgi:hypothetical protein